MKLSHLTKEIQAVIVEDELVEDKTDYKKINSIEEVTDLQQQMRDYAVKQMENSPAYSHIHHKIRHYD